MPVALRAARPTAVNLAWGVDRALARLEAGPDAVLEEALAIRDEDIAACAAMATRGADLVQQPRAATGDPGDDDLQHRRPRGGRARHGARRHRGAPRARRPRGGAAARDPAAAPGRTAHRLGARADGRAVPPARRRCGGLGARARHGGRRAHRRRPDHRQRRHGEQGRVVLARARGAPRRRPVRRRRARVHGRPRDAGRDGDRDRGARRRRGDRVPRRAERARRDPHAQPGVRRHAGVAHHRDRHRPPGDRPARRRDARRAPAETLR